MVTTDLSTFLTSKDFSDGMNLQCFASFVFLYFAVLTPIITFGGLLGDATDNNIAVVESLVGACIAGILFHMFAGQPLTIIGSTGPILIFERISFAMTIKLGLDYLEFRHRLKFLKGSGKGPMYGPLKSISIAFFNHEKTMDRSLDGNYLYFDSCF